MLKPLTFWLKINWMTSLEADYWLQFCLEMKLVAVLVGTLLKTVSENKQFCIFIKQNALNSKIRGMRVLRGRSVRKITILFQGCNTFLGSDVTKMYFLLSFRIITKESAQLGPSVSCAICWSASTILGRTPNDFTLWPYFHVCRIKKGHERSGVKA